MKMKNIFTIVEPRVFYRSYVHQNPRGEIRAGARREIKTVAGGPHRKLLMMIHLKKIENASKG